MGQAVIAGPTVLVAQIVNPDATVARVDAIVQTTALAGPFANAVQNFCLMELAIVRMDADAGPLASALANVNAAPKIRRWSAPNRAITKQNQEKRSFVVVVPNADAALSVDAVHPAAARI